MILFSFLIIFCHGLYWTEEENIIQFTGNETYDKDWKYSFTAEFSSESSENENSSSESYSSELSETFEMKRNGSLTETFSFRSTCCENETKWFDGITNMNEQRFCENCEFIERYKIFEFGEEIKGNQLKTIHIMTNEEDVGFQFKGEHFPNGLNINFCCDETIIGSERKCREKITKEHAITTIWTSKSFSYSSCSDNQLRIRRGEKEGNDKDN